MLESETIRSLNLADTMALTIRKKIGRRLMPVLLFRTVCTNYWYDMKRFVKWSGITGKYDDRTRLRAKITINYHRLEKGLALRSPRPGFGLPVAKQLLADVRAYQESFGCDETSQAAIGVLMAHEQFNRQNGIETNLLSQGLLAFQEETGGDPPLALAGGVKWVQKRQIHEAAKLDISSFFQSRHSVRQFAPDEVDMALVERAVTLAQKSPSVCNRQAWKVHVITAEDEKRKVLDLQNGSRGFGDQANKVLIVTVELGNFLTVGERNQGWVDGGMFAMSLVYALHSLGLGTCCLNWAVRHERDRQLKHEVDISNSESIIMMIAVGHLPDEFPVAQATRRNVKGMLIVR